MERQLRVVQFPLAADVVPDYSKAVASEAILAKLHINLTRHTKQYT
jgi:hypothetical protein